MNTSPIELQCRGCLSRLLGKAASFQPHTSYQRCDDCIKNCIPPQPPEESDDDLNGH